MQSVCVPHACCLLHIIGLYIHSHLSYWLPLPLVLLPTFSCHSSFGCSGRGLVPAYLSHWHRGSLHGLTCILYPSCKSAFLLVFLCCLVSILLWRFLVILINYWDPKKSKISKLTCTCTHTFRSPWGWHVCLSEMQCIGWDIRLLEWQKVNRQISDLYLHSSNCHILYRTGHCSTA